MNTLRDTSGEDPTTALTKANSATSKLDEGFWFEVSLRDTAVTREASRSQC